MCCAQAALGTALDSLTPWVGSRQLSELTQHKLLSQLGQGVLDDVVAALGRSSERKKEDIIAELRSNHCTITRVLHLVRNCAAHQDERAGELMWR